MKLGPPARLANPIYIQLQPCADFLFYSFSDSNKVKSARRERANIGAVTGLLLIPLPKKNQY
jgi:hypothetical protein